LVISPVLYFQRFLFSRNYFGNYQFRNVYEGERIRPTLASLEKLDYPADRFEVILIDDNSDDNTAELIEQSAEEHAHWKALRYKKASDKYHAKKMALAFAINEAKGGIIFTTDADCRLPESWLSSMVRYFDENTMMVLGYSPLEHRKGLLHKWLAFDNLFSAIVVAAPTALGFPYSSVGRNMAFSKSEYDQVGGYASLIKFKSGDDIHLTECMRDNCKGKIVFSGSADTFVETRPPSSLKDIFHQQVRKNSVIFDKSLGSNLFSLALLAAYLLFFTLPLFNREWLFIWIIVLGTKFILEFIALTCACFIFRLKKLIPFLPVIQFLYPFYIMFFGFLGTMHFYKWKK